MAKIYEQIPEKLKQFIEKQHIFFVATAAEDGRVNLSPKGMDSLRVTGENEVVWLNLTGSGNETAAHLKKVNRMTIMFCSYEKNPMILRLYGTAETIHPGDARWEELSAHFFDSPGARQIFIMQVAAVQTSCGYAVPFYEYKGERDTLKVWSDKKGESGIRDYWQEKNRESIDGFETGIPEL